MHSKRPTFSIFAGANLKQLLLIFLLAFSCNAMAEWVEYTTRANGDVHYFDNARVQKDDNNVSVWNRVRYRTSVMGASSYQSFLKIDCSENSEITLQSTFFSDKDWTTPSMATNTKAKPKKNLKANSAAEQLAKIVCEE